MMKMSLTGAALSENNPDHPHTRTKNVACAQHETVRLSTVYGRLAVGIAVITVIFWILTVLKLFCDACFRFCPTTRLSGDLIPEKKKKKKQVQRWLGNTLASQASP